MVATIIINVLIVLGVIYGVRRTVKKKGCCDTGTSVKLNKVKDKDPSHYPYKTEMICDDMFCDNCKKKVMNTLNSFDGNLTEVDLSSKKITVLSKNKPDPVSWQHALKEAGYPARLVH